MLFNDGSNFIYLNFNLHGLTPYSIILDSLNKKIKLRDYNIIYNQVNILRITFYSILHVQKVCLKFVYLLEKYYPNLIFPLSYLIPIFKHY